MAKNWAICIGVNRYDNLPDLKYPVRDAQLMRDFLLNEAGFDHVYLFTDDSPQITDAGKPFASQPTYGTLRRFLRVRFNNKFLGNGDNLWFYFSGHGLRDHNRDYLMPCDGDPDPEGIEQTAISINYIGERLRCCGADNVVLFLDACRNENSAKDAGIGEIRQQGIITIASCLPGKRSYEIEQLRQGSFTYALLESLRIQGEGNCATVERLDKRLQYRVNQINQQYRKPRQTPYAIAEPASKYHLILLPRLATLVDVETLKKDALSAEVKNNLSLAKQLWIRILGVSPADPEALEAYERIILKQSASQVPTPPKQPLPRQPSNSPTSKSSSQTNADSEPLESQARTTRKQPEFYHQQFYRQQPSSRSIPQSSPRFHKARQNTKTKRPNINLPQVNSITRRQFFQGVSAVSATAGLTWLFSNFRLGQKYEKQISENKYKFATVKINNQGKVISREIKEAEFFTEDLENGVTLEMVSIPGGEFTMGAPASEKLSEDNERPQHKVTIQPFFMGKFEVTQAQWKVVASLPKIERDLQPEPYKYHFGFHEGDNLPVNASWYDGVEFCARLSKKTGRQYRLPSEAEWEYACRAGTTTPFYFGETITSKLANYRGKVTYGAEPKGKSRGKVTPVGSFFPNAFGLYDMHGNMSEWCEDHWHDNYEGAPIDGSPWLFKNDNRYHVDRGGAWNGSPDLSRSAVREPGLPDDSFVCFRVCCEVSKTY